jgi:hypothetical protein
MVPLLQRLRWPTWTGSMALRLATLPLLISPLLRAGAVGATPAPGQASPVAVAPAASCSGWSIVPSPNPGRNSYLYGVAAVSARNVWAVGDYDNASGVQQTLIEHWNGARWRVIPSPSPGTIANFLSALAVVSATDHWAVGDYSNGSFQTLIEHYC